jgi:hypothetical protein
MPALDTGAPVAPTDARHGLGPGGQWLDDPGGHEAVDGVLARAGCRDARAAVCVVECRDAVTHDMARFERAALLEAGACRRDDVVRPYHQGVVVAAGPFAHPAHAEAFARKLAVALNVPHVGLAIFPNHGLTSDALVKHAAESTRLLDSGADTDWAGHMNRGE